MVHIQSVKAARTSINRRREDIQAFAAAPNLDMKDKVVVILGNSPALKEVDLSVLDDVVTIGVNRVAGVYKPSALLFTDPPIYYVEKETYDTFEGPIFTWHGITHSLECLKRPNVRYFNLQPEIMNLKHIKWPSTLDDPLIREGTTPPYAIQMAVLGGAKAVGILGVDHSAPDRHARGQETHFFGTVRGSWYCRACTQWCGPKQVVRRNRARVCPNCRAENQLMRLASTGGGGWTKVHDAFYKQCRQWAAARGTAMFNLSPFADTLIHKAEWPKMTCEDLVRTHHG